jgi:hypothetical protein
VLSFYRALRSRSGRAAATAFIRARAAAHRRWISARSRPVPVSPTPKRWLQGQLKFLTQQAPTAPGKLREDQILNLIASDGIKPRTATVPPTVPAQDRHPWAGFPASRPLSIASVDLSHACFTTSKALHLRGAQYTRRTYELYPTSGLTSF